MGVEKHNNFIVKLRKLLGDRYNYDDVMEKKLESAFELLSKVKKEHPDIDMNYLLTGKNESVGMIARINITHSDVKYEDRSINIEKINSVDELKDQIRKQDKTINEQVLLIRELINSVDQKSG